MTIHEIKQFNESINKKSSEIHKNQWNESIQTTQLVKINENQRTSIELNNSMNPSIKINGNQFNEINQFHESINKM